MEGQINYTLMPSLELRALIKTAIALWNQDNIKALTSNFYISFLFIFELQEEWQKIEDKVIEKVQELPLPESLKKMVSDIIKPIGFEILKWRKYHENILNLSRDPRLVRKILSNLCWTPEGTVDRKKTAEVLIKNENLDIIHSYGDENVGIAESYELACTYCLKNEILTQWNKMPEEFRIYFSNKEYPTRVFQRDLVFFWTYYIKGEVSRIYTVIHRSRRNCSPYQYAFEYAVGEGSRVATEYFFQKLTSKERKESLVKSAKCALKNYSNFYDCFVVKVVPEEEYAGVLCFLLSQMNEEQQEKVFKYHPCLVLQLLLDWPWQGFFMETAKRMWAFLSEKDYDLLLSLIVSKVIDGFKDYNYHKLLREFWQQSPRTYKEYVINEFASGSLFKNLLQAKDKENIKLFLKYATTPEREKIIFSCNGKSACKMLIYNDEMDLIEFFVQECLPSKDIIIKFREEFIRTVFKVNLSKEEREEQKVMFTKFYRLINNLIRKDNKRDVEEGSSGPAKRLCSLKDE